MRVKVEINRLIIFVLLLLLLGNCNTQKNDLDELDGAAFTPYILPSLCWWKDFPQNSVVIINSKGDLANFVRTNEKLPEIDFSKYSIILAGGETNAGVERIESQITKVNKNELTLNITVHLLITAEIGHWKSAYLSSKLKKTKIDLNVTVNEY